MSEKFGIFAADLTAFFCETSGSKQRKSGIKTTPKWSGAAERGVASGSETSLLP
jgi:hypothetical protein